jgi:hypothetical protein
VERAGILRGVLRIVGSRGADREIVVAVAVEVAGREADAEATWSGKARVA